MNRIAVVRTWMDTQTRANDRLFQGVEPRQQAKLAPLRLRCSRLSSGLGQIACGEVCAVRLGRQRRPGCRDGQLAAGERRPLGPHALLHPPRQHLEVPAPDRGVHRRVAQLRAQRPHLLRRRHRPERVRGEEADVADRPVHVLQRTLRRRAVELQADVLLHLARPHRRDVGDRELALEHHALDLVAQDDVQRVRELVGVDADRARAHAAVQREQGVVRPLNVVRD
mmetsp:Transcript_37011/g.114317  ORF Transcript_37011/g.114317 Transcript_37011/m.114317 type:complete len:225 (+) Transcript_37011:52-726(+)